jgi:hypothetical protein
LYYVLLFTPLLAFRLELVSLTLEIEDVLCAL